MCSIEMFGQIGQIFYSKEFRSIYIFVKYKIKYVRNPELQLHTAIQWIIYTYKEILKCTLFVILNCYLLFYVR